MHATVQWAKNSLLRDFCFDTIHCEFAIAAYRPVNNKKAELSQRWPRDAPYYGCPENFRQSLSTPTATFPEIFNGLLFRSILWMRLQNLKFVAFPVSEIMGSIQKISAVPGYAHAPFSVKFLMGFCSDGPCECTGQVWSPYAFARSWDTSDWSFGWRAKVLR